LKYVKSVDVKFKWGMFSKYYWYRRYKQFCYDYKKLIVINYFFF
jgi:hypothetical protein